MEGEKRLVLGGLGSTVVVSLHESQTVEDR